VGNFIFDSQSPLIKLSMNLHMARNSNHDDFLSSLLAAQAALASTSSMTSSTGRTFEMTSAA